MVSSGIFSGEIGLVKLPCRQVTSLRPVLASISENSSSPRFDTAHIQLAGHAWTSLGGASVIHKAKQTSSVPSFDNIVPFGHRRLQCFQNSSRIHGGQNLKCCSSQITYWVCPFTNLQIEVLFQVRHCLQIWYKMCMLVFQIPIGYICKNKSNR